MINLQVSSSGLISELCGSSLSLELDKSLDNLRMLPAADVAGADVIQLRFLRTGVNILLNIRGKKAFCAENKAIITSLLENY